MGNLQTAHIDAKTGFAYDFENGPMEVEIESLKRHLMETAGKSQEQVDELTKTRKASVLVRRRRS